MLFALFVYAQLLRLVYVEQNYGVVFIGYVYTSTLELGVLSGLSNPIFHVAKCF